MNYLILSTLILFTICSSAIHAKEEKCKIPPEAPKKISEVITVCEDEIKIQIIAEALLALEADAKRSKKLTKRAVTSFTEDDRRIAGCLLQCVYKKLNAVNEQGTPTMEGLVSLYSGGSRDRPYVLATLKAVNYCMNKIQEKYLKYPLPLQGDNKSCERAYDIFECVSEEIGEYCGSSP